MIMNLCEKKMYSVSKVFFVLYLYAYISTLPTTYTDSGNLLPRHISNVYYSMKRHIRTSY